MDSSYHVQTNLSVRRGVILGISAHIIQNEKVLYFFSVYILKASKFSEVKVDVQKGGPKD